ncbi:major facilitator superfamily domain-containing protein [Clohesyomyces aquaticus]|uniref:Major facilitator superfamily domain-containing protein n=1 Tax=Clohesyomyces aquaticus TaxID=1231657 RepID=A0A1Y1ZU80_9PLEO|nr:major facilitator superfamily domain-containing protein [Clohesyomyces aquaticus]
MPTPENSDPETTTPSESQPLLKPPSEQDWKPPCSFLWIELAIFANFILYGFDGTTTTVTYAVISSEFDAANTASWLTTAYLVISTAFQPLYGRFSDIFGRRVCFFVSTITFAMGCLGCGVAKNIVLMNCMRALTGFGGGATIVNSDMIPFRKRGMYQALQNGMFGFGAICGASFGGSIADTIGWRWCFLLQVPFPALALFLGYLVIKNPREIHPSLGGNELPWSSGWVVGAITGSAVLFGGFFLVEKRTSAIPVIPLRMLKGRNLVAIRITNVCAGTSAYAYLFTLPLFFQVVLLDTATAAGSRLAIPSLATPIGGLVAGIVMSRWGYLILLVRTGAILMACGNALVTSLSFYDSKWKYLVHVFPANLGYVWGVAITSAIIQNTLAAKLPDALAGVPDRENIIPQIRHSTTALLTMEPDIQLKARLVHYEGLRYAFAASTGIAGVGIMASFFARGGGLRSTA